MAGAVALTNSGTISNCDATTNWTGDTFVLEPDIKTEGTNSVSWAATNTGTNDAYVASSFDFSGNQHLRLTFQMSYGAYFSSTNAIQIYLSDGTNTDYVTVYGSASDYPGGFVDVVLDVNLFTTVTLSSITQVGVRVNTSSKPRNIVNSWADNWRYIDGMILTSATTEAFDFTDAAGIDASSVYWVLRLIDGTLFSTGEILIGSTGSANANLVSSNELLVFPERSVNSSLYKIKTQEGTGNTDVDISGLVAKSVASNGVTLDISSSLNTLSLTGSSFINFGAMTITPTVTSPTFDSNVFSSCGTTAISLTATACTWVGCGQITISGSGELDACVVDSTTASAAVLAADLADVTDSHFVSDGSSHAVQLSGAAATYSWGATLASYDAGTSGNGVEVTGGSITGNEAIYIPASTGTYTINVSSTATVPSVATGGAVVNVVAGAVSVTVTATTKTGTPIQSARVLLRAKDATGPFPYDETVTISNSATTATVTHTGHGMATGDYVQITGASLSANNGVFQIAVSDANTYTYTMPSTPGSSPTGTIKATFVALYGLTDVNGEITTTRTYSSSQPVDGWARKSSSSPYYQEGVLTGSVSSTNGYNATAVMISDE